jgi:hypothetical protein
MIEQQIIMPEFILFLMVAGKKRRVAKTTSYEISQIKKPGPSTGRG